MSIVFSDSEDSKEWEDDFYEFDSSLLLRLPEPALLSILHNLRYHDIRQLSNVIPEISHLCEVEISKLKKEFPSRPYYIFNRCAPSEREEEMTERRKVCMTYSSRDASVYLFGGEAIGSDNIQTAHATFNDLWKLNLVTMKWARVVIPAAPYPSPKCHASLVTWKNKLVLFGGHHPVPGGRGSDPIFVYEPEVHLFDIETCTWRYIPNDNGPNLAGHSAVVHNDLMVVYGGWEDQYRERYESWINIFDLKTETWHVIVLDKNDKDVPFPRMDSKKSKLVFIREGLLLITGEMAPGDYGSSILIQYDPRDPLHSKWQWKPVDTTGRWWDEKVIQGERSAICSFPNYNFHPIAEVRNEKTIRLISLGSLRNDRKSRAFYNDYYDEVQSRYRAFCRELKCKLEAEFQKRSGSGGDADLLSTCFTFSFRDIRCRIQNCFLRNLENIERLPRHLKANAHSFKVTVKFLRSQGAACKRMDDFDEWEARSSIRATVNQLHAKYYNIGRLENLAARVPMRNGMLRRLSVYTAEISADANFEDFGELRWIPQSQQYQAPAETEHYSLIGANQEIIMHAGSVHYNQSMRRMGQCTLFVPAKVIQKPNIDAPFLLF